MGLSSIELLRRRMAKESKIQFHVGDAATILATLPEASVACCVTSPPYWRKRVYDSGGIGWEDTPEAYVNELARAFDQIHRVLKDSGSLWINIADTYHKSGGMVGIPWKLAHTLSEAGWVVRNDVIWNKGPGPDKATDRLTFCHEHIFHLVKRKSSTVVQPYYYNDSAIRGDPIHHDKTKLLAKSVVRIYNNKFMIASQKKTAGRKLRQLIDENVAFVMILKGQRTPHGLKRRRELNSRGFYFMLYDTRGGKFPDVWNISGHSGPVGRDSIEHGASFPEEICNIPIATTCPPRGVVIDPFCGTGTTARAAKRMRKKFIGIDISPTYIAYARDSL